MFNMFRQMKNIDTAFRYVRAFSLVFVLACTLITGFAIYSGHRMVTRSAEKIYVLANDKALEAISAERKDNIPVEAKDHVKMFHHYFFTQDPDDKVIQSNMAKALYLADASAKRQYDNLRENGYFNNLIAGNVSQVIEADSILIGTDSYPYYFMYKGVQTITRPSAVVSRSLVTEGYLRNVSRSDNNSHGFLIERWRTLENRDVKIVNR
jgi:conjugative transposon TraK protein